MLALFILLIALGFFLGLFHKFGQLAEHTPLSSLGALLITQCVAGFVKEYAPESHSHWGVFVPLRLLRSSFPGSSPLEGDRGVVGIIIYYIILVLAFVVRAFVIGAHDNNGNQQRQVGSIGLTG